MMLKPLTERNSFGLLTMYNKTKLRGEIDLDVYFYSFFTPISIFMLLPSVLL